jgi:hypothetical protein
MRLVCFAGTIRDHRVNCRALDRTPPNKIWLVSDGGASGRADLSLPGRLAIAGYQVQESAWFIGVMSG